MDMLTQFTLVGQMHGFERNDYVLISKKNFQIITLFVKFSVSWKV